MGSFYVNFAVKSRKRQVIEAALRGRRAAVSAARGGWVIVLDAEADRQEPEVIRSLAKLLSLAAGAPVLAALNHDDDVLWLLLCTNGEEVDEYDSAPSYFADGEGAPPKGGNARLLCRTFKRSRRARAVEQILRAPAERYVFARERHAELALELGVPAHALGYKKLGGHPLEDGLDGTDLVEALHRERAASDPVGTRGQPLTPPPLLNGMLAERPPDPTQYSAVYRRSDGGERREWVDGDFRRSERWDPDLKEVYIERPDRDLIYVNRGWIMGFGGPTSMRLRPIAAARGAFTSREPQTAWRPLRVEVINGREATLFEGIRDGALRERSWCDHATGLQLRLEETVRDDGSTALRVETLDIRIGPPPAHVFDPEWLH